jgi:hypothetical protein
MNFPGWKAILPMLCAVCLILAGADAWFNRFLSWQPIVWIGLISYPLYLWHWPLISYAYIILGRRPEGTFRAGLLALVFVLATLTYVCVERPIRFGQRARGAKTIALVALLAALAGVGGGVYWSGEQGSRKHVAGTKDFYKHMTLRAGPLYDSSCLRKLGIAAPLPNGFCRFRNAGGDATILLFGDSHAEVAFPSIAEYNAQAGINTLLLGLGYGQPVLTNENFLALTFRFLEKTPDIHKVFVILRGNVYIKKDTDSHAYPTLLVGEEEFRNHMQKLVDKLVTMNKTVFIVAENPVLPAHIRHLLPSFQPLRSPVRYDLVQKSDVLKNQREYLDALRRIRGATILYTLDAFCPNEVCLLVDEDGMPLYRDDDHLSVQIGGNFLIDRVLAPHLRP